MATRGCTSSSLPCFPGRSQVAATKVSRQRSNAVDYAWGSAPDPPYGFAAPSSRPPCVLDRGGKSFPCTHLRRLSIDQPRPAGIRSTHLGCGLAAGRWSSLVAGRKEDHLRRRHSGDRREHLHSQRRWNRTHPSDLRRQRRRPRLGNAPTRSLETRRHEGCACPPCCPMRWSTEDCHGHSRTTLRASQPGSTPVSQVTEETYGTGRRPGCKQQCRHPALHLRIAIATSSNLRT